uniref:Uncharacterized protein n=1 Tax=Panagrolaimus superbus TaxID=310955 RepID=A0A914YQM1_9BILA
MYKKNCPQAKFVMFPFEKFPDRVKDLNNYIFKPLYIAMAMRNHKVLLSFDSSIFFVSNANITNLIQTAVKENPTDVSLLRTAYHSNFLTTHPKMYDCFPDIKPNDMQRVVQYNGGLVLWVGSEEGWTAMHRWVECALQPTCMAPLGATKTCDVKVKIHFFGYGLKASHLFGIRLHNATFLFCF